VTVDAHRLPTAIRPLHYELRLEPDLEAATFTGSGMIRIEAAETSTSIVLNAIELDVTEAWIVTADGTRLETAVELDAALERAVLTPTRPLPAGTHELHTRFAGILNDKLRGFYRSTFTDHAGHERTIATTQFESTNARRAFPCWDEPAFKATFGVTLVVDEGLFAVSCAAEVSRTPTADGRVAVRFGDTMPMSTYLVAFIVGPLEATDPVDVNGTPLRIVHPLGQGHLTPFALECGAFCVRYFEDYFGIPYPGDKLDLVAVPDFAFGAMENLGCVTFREVLLLIDPAAATQPELQRAADVIAHEIAHMWFGDLVTMAWWEGLWLKEAFATFMEMKATDAYRPDWQRWVDFGLSKTAAYDTDALATTRPIEYEVVSPADAEGMYDILTYEKGAAVVRMLEQYLGEEQFRDGVRLYLSRHAYGNTRTTDLWDALEESTGQPVRAVMDSWIFQGGFPLVSVELAPSGGSLSLQQERFRYTGAGEGRWQVPVIVDTVHRDTRQSRRVLLDGPSAVLSLTGVAEAIVGNAGGHGFYRTRYGRSGLAALTERAQELLVPIERYNLVDDTYAAMLAGQARATDVLALCRGLAHDDDLSVWQRIAGALGGLSRMVGDIDRAAFERAVRDIATPALDIVGWEPAAGEGDRQRELRATLFSLLGTTGNDSKVAELAARLHEAEGTEPSLAAAALTVLARHGDETRWEQFRQRSVTATNPQELRRYIFALADLPDTGLVTRTLELARSGAIKSQDGPFVVARSIANRDVAAAAWTFVEENFAELEQRFPSNTIARMLSTITTITDPGLARRVDAFLAEHPVPQGARTVAQNVEKMQVMVSVAQRESAALAAAVR
jgi:puromycin-sensitive aminopeptidase